MEERRIAFEIKRPSSVDGHLDCFQILTITNNAAANISSVQFSHTVMSDSLQPHGLQHARLPCASPTPGACSNSSPLNQ